MWCLYLLECADGSYYCGISTDLAKRVRRHNAGSGARYTRSRRPVKVLISVSGLQPSVARRLEREIKRLPRAKKIAAIKRLGGVFPDGLSGAKIRGVNYEEAKEGQPNLSGVSL